MATKSSISINYTTAAGKKGQKALTNVNPTASNDVLKTFAGMVNSLTTSTYIGTTRVDKTPLKSANELTAPTIICTQKGEDFIESADDAPKPTTATFAECQAQTMFFRFEFDTDAVPYVKSMPELANACVQYSATPSLLEIETYRSAVIMVFVPANNAKCLGDFVICWPETDTYAAATRTISVSGGE